MSHWTWREGNRLRLLENGEEYFPAVFAAIAAAQKEVLIETFILFEDKVGTELQQLIGAAARRGVSVDLTVDGYGSDALSDAFIADMQQAGVRVRMFAPGKRLLGSRINLFRRLHRKIVVVDGELAFIGGINFSEDHLLSFGPKSKQDYAVAIEGPLVADIRQLALPSPAASPRRRWWQRSRALANVVSVPPIGSVRALLAHRDNRRHRDDIERLYRMAIRSSKHRIVIANAYFFPGYRLLRALRSAARRGVKVQLILQGNPDMPWARVISHTLYPHLAKAGVEILEFCERPIHAKVAVIDDWATVGSSNLDPLSLALNLEANVCIDNAAFAEQLHQRLEQLMANSCQRLDSRKLRRPSLPGLFLGFIAFHFTRHFPTLARWLPAHFPVRKLLTQPQAVE